MEKINVDPFVLGRKHEINFVITTIETMLNKGETMEDVFEFLYNEQSKNRSIK